jgi:hypothetical protein
MANQINISAENLLVRNLIVSNLANQFSDAKIKSNDWIEADNLDQIRLISSEGLPVNAVVENEHGSTYSLDELSLSEISVFSYLLSNPE